MDHSLPAKVAGGILSEAHVTWTFVPNDGDGSTKFTWDIGHRVTAESDGEPLVEWFVGDPKKATTSRRTVENSIRRFLEQRYAAEAV